jgi:hypothetical protein
MSSVAPARAGRPVSAARRWGRDARTAVDPVVEPAESGPPALVLPVAGLARPVETVSPGGPPSADAPRPAGGPLRRLQAGATVPAPQSLSTSIRVLRRAPQPTATVGEFIDPDAPGFVFVSGSRDNEYIIKGSDIRVVWDPADRRWLDPSGIPVSFQSAPTAGPRPLLELPATLPVPRTRTMPAVGSKEWNHYNLTMDDFKRLNLWDQMLRIAELASSFPVTPIELYWRDKPREKTSRFYRYHKFPLDPTAQQLVFGGGINKTEITDEWLANNLKKLIKTRFDLLAELSSGVSRRQVKAMQDFQANAMSTPFIATTTDESYARSLYREYPPTAKQKAVVLVIEGPMSHAFDFEAEFEAIGGQAGGRAEWHWRTKADRAKDANQAEFGLPDLFIPLHGVSPLGFRIVDVIELGVPDDHPDLLLDLTADQRLQLVRAQRMPRRGGSGNGGKSETGEND